ncbi:MAG: exodeoxyribonuclease VII small subunit [Treponemataceae bacterium]|nr:exodeoxyribonuclease VII small subunit [Treponemataceae bacterium]
MKSDMKFEDKLERLEAISNGIKKNDISLEDALAYFEEGIKLARGLEKDLEQIEGKIQILMNGQAAGSAPSASADKPELSLFDGLDD